MLAMFPATDAARLAIALCAREVSAAKLITSGSAMDYRCLTSLVTAALFLGYASPSSSQTPSAKNWQYYEFTDRMDDKKSSFIDVMASETILRKPARSESRNKQAILRIGCRRKQTELKLIVENELIASHENFVSYRLDGSAPVKTRTWEASTDYTHVGLWRTSASVPIIKAMMAHKSMLIRVEQRVFGVTEAVFNVEGLEVAVKPIREACKW